MKGVSFVTNDKNERVAVQIDLKILKRHNEELENMLSSIIEASAHETEKTTSDKEA